MNESTGVKYRTIYADPPWPEQGGGVVKRGADRHYPLMGVDEIIYFMRSIPVEDDAHLYLWVTNNFLMDGLRVVDTMDFRYITNIVWVKDRIGLGQYFRGQHELCLFAVKGRLPYKHEVSDTRASCTESTLIMAPRRKHSQKPDEIYTKIEDTSYPPYLEVFARGERDGWDSFGNELPGWVPPYTQQELGRAP